MDETLALKFFKEINAVWGPASQGRRIIPFCTPVFSRPSALVIGKNHSDFARGNAKLAAAIADEFAARIPTENTLVKHSHLFAKGLRNACRAAGITVDETWMGTNRCAVQTDSHGITALKRQCNEFAECQCKMDDLLRRFVEVVRPVNLILAGNYAISLYYDPDRKCVIDDLACFELRHASEDIKVIPIHHPSRGSFHKRIANRMSKCFVRR
jgi:hypothetical protein